jgi:hypothetical protein
MQQQIEQAFDPKATPYDFVTKAGAASILAKRLTIHGIAKWT